MFVLALTLACGGTPTSTAGAQAEAPTAAAPEATTAAAAADPAAAAARTAFDPLAGQSLAAICRDDGLALIKWDFDQLQQGFHDLCCGPDGIAGEMGCELDWPFNDVPPCDAYDTLRNHIFARYGYPFTKAEWQERFGSQPWYTRHDDFDASWLSPAARRNIDKLKQLKASKTGCAG